MSPVTHKKGVWTFYALGGPQKLEDQACSGCESQDQQTHSTVVQVEDREHY